MGKYSKYRNELFIDKYNLDEELVKQPQRYFDWALKAVQAAGDKDAAKKDLDIVRAEAEDEIRKDPKKHGINEKGKITEAMIRNAVMLHERVKEYNANYLEAVMEERVLEKMEKSFSSRKKSLEGLVQLDLRLHFSEPKTSKGYKENKESERGDTKRTICRNLKRRK